MRHNPPFQLTPPTGKDLLPDISAPLGPELRPDLPRPRSPASSFVAGDGTYHLAAGAAASFLETCIFYPIDVARVLAERDGNEDWISLLFHRILTHGPWSLYRAVLLAAVVEPVRRILRFLALRHLRTALSEITPWSIVRARKKLHSILHFFLINTSVFSPF